MGLGLRETDLHRLLLPLVVSSSCHYVSRVEFGVDGSDKNFRRKHARCTHGLSCYIKTLLDAHRKCRCMISEPRKLVRSACCRG